MKEVNTNRKSQWSIYRKWNEYEIDENKEKNKTEYKSRLLFDYCELIAT